jgi:hypothetical protein
MNSCIVPFFHLALMIIATSFKMVRGSSAALLTTLGSSSSSVHGNSLFSSSSSNTPASSSDNPFSNSNIPASSINNNVFHNIPTRRTSKRALLHNKRCEAHSAAVAADDYDENSSNDNGGDANPIDGVSTIIINEHATPPHSTNSNKRKGDKARFRQHVNPLSEKYQQPADLPSNFLSSCYRNATLPFLLDIGCAKGNFCLEMAAHAVDHNYLGVEIRKGPAEYANERAERRQLKNCHFLSTNANVDLKRILDLIDTAESTVDQVTM